MTPRALCYTCDGTGTVADEALSADGVCPVCDGRGWLEDPQPVRLHYYRLEGTHPIREPDGRAWAQWFGTADRLVARTVVGPAVEVSTLFIGLDYGRHATVPFLFESRVFGGPLDGEQERYATWQDAEQGHAALVARCRRVLRVVQP